MSGRRALDCITRDAIFTATTDGVEYKNYPFGLFTLLRLAASIFRGLDCGHTPTDLVDYTAFKFQAN